MNSKECHNCFYLGMCVYFSNRFDPTICTFFKHKSRIVELPCEVGQYVWFVFRDILNGRKNSKIITEKRKIIRIHQNCLKKWAIDTICEPSMGTMTFDLELHLGKNIFFDEEEAKLAEEALQRMQEQTFKRIL